MDRKPRLVIDLYEILDLLGWELEITEQAITLKEFNAAGQLASRTGVVNSPDAMRMLPILVLLRALRALGGALQIIGRVGEAKGEEKKGKARRKHPPIPDKGTDFGVEIKTGW